MCGVVLARRLWWLGRWPIVRWTRCHYVVATQRSVLDTLVDRPKVRRAHAFCPLSLPIVHSRLVGTPLCTTLSLIAYLPLFHVSRVLCPVPVLP